jgi:lipopolysaccharide/colanic/teichoic acid biosynthesis glycosyltransferase
MDVTGAVVGLVVLSPVLGAVALMIRLAMGRPVLFVQVRAGHHGRPFRLVKFRTMAASPDDSNEPLPDAARLTPLGRWLRATSLDELPELWNVLSGDMSLVGPRPLLIEYLPLYSAEQARRHDVRPGITGWSQVNGRNATTWPERLGRDVWYVDHLSPWLDARILCLTVIHVLQRRGINQPGQATMQRFHGATHHDA